MDSDIEFPKGIMTKLQTYMTEKIAERGLSDETLQERMILLTEEIGELAKVVRYSTGMNVNKDKKEMSKAGEEITDVLNMTFAVAIALGLNVEEEYRKKEIKNDQRTYKKAG